MLNIQNLIDDAKCYATVREMRWPEGVTRPQCASQSITKQGRDDTQPQRQRYQCQDCRKRFDGHHFRRTPPALKGLDSVPVLHGTEPVQ